MQKCTFSQFLLEQHNNISSTQVESVIEWVVSYIESSFNMADQYLTNTFVRTKILPTLHTLNPTLPIINTPCYRSIKYNAPQQTGSKLVIKSNKVISWTTYDSAEYWHQIADDVGILGEDYVYVVKAQSPITAFLTPDYLQSLQIVLEKSDMVFKTRYVSEFLNMDLDWQREVVADGSKPVTAVVIHSIEY